MEKVVLSQKDQEDIAQAFINQKISEPQKGEFYYFSSEEAEKYIFTYLDANGHSNFIYGLENREAFVVIRRENEYLKFIDIFKMIFRTYKILGFKKVRKIQNIERNGPLPLEEKYALQKKKFLFVGMVVVKEEYQGQGYFRKLLEEVFTMAKQENRLVVLNTDTFEKCQKYQHLDFKIIQKRELEENNIRYDLVWKNNT